MSVQWKRSSNGNPTALYRGFRATQFSAGDTYVYLGDRRVGRMFPEEFQTMVDEYYEGIYVNYLQPLSYKHTAPDIQGMGTLRAQGVINKGNGEGKVFTGSVVECDHYTIEILEADTSMSNSGKTQWYETKYRMLHNGVVVKPVETNAVPINPDTKPGITGHYQSHTYNNGGITLNVSDKEGNSWSVRMTNKFSQTPQIAAKLDSLPKGALINTTVSIKTNEWAGEQYFNDFHVIDADNTHISEVSSFDF